MKLLSVRDLSFQRQGYFAYKHVTFSLSQKESVSITGDSGSGKTALLETLAGLNYPDSGTASYTTGARVGFMPQIETEIINDSVVEHLEKIRQLTGDLAVRSDQAKDLAAYMGMSPFMDRKVSTLSVGLRQRVSFLAAVIGRPNILILDDPFSFQNSTYITNMLEIVKDLEDNGSGILVAGPMNDSGVDAYFDTNYQMKAKSLEPKNLADINLMLVFKITPDSMAITKELGAFVAAELDGVVELKVPAIHKDAIIKTMIELNYQFEGMRNLEA